VQDVTGAPLPPVAIQGRQLQPGWQGGTLLAAAGARALFAYDARVGLFLVHFRHEQRRRVAAVCALAAAAAAGSLEDVRPRPPPPPPPRTKWTCRVPHPVLIGHAASPLRRRTDTPPPRARTASRGRQAFAEIERSRDWRGRFNAVSAQLEHAQAPPL
jgi:hypothetical protein